MRNSLKITSIKRVQGDKFQPKFEQVIVREDTGAVNLLSIMNEGDDRFSVAKPTYAYPSYTGIAVAKHLGVDLLQLESLSVGESLEIELIDPTIQGFELNIQINETLVDAKDFWKTTVDKSTGEVKIVTYAKKIVDKTTKQDVYFTVNDQFIHRTTSVVAGPAKHVQFKDAVKASAPVATKITASEGLAVL